MVVKELKYEGKNAIMIYISKEENNSEEGKKKINNLKKQYKSIAVFVSGTGSIEKTLKRIIQDEYDRLDI